MHMSKPNPRWATMAMGAVGEAAEAGYQAILVGETLMRAADRRSALAALGGHAVTDRLPIAVNQHKFRSARIRA